MSYSDMMFPKASWGTGKKSSKKQNKVESIMQHKDDKRCYLCMLLENNYEEHEYLEEHHVLFGVLHKISDLYGFRVNLCTRHHREGKEAVHNNKHNARLLIRNAQALFIGAYPNLNWMQIVGRNYFDETTEEIDIKTQKDCKE